MASVIKRTMLLRHAGAVEDKSTKLTLKKKRKSWLIKSTDNNEVIMEHDKQWQESVATEC